MADAPADEPNAAAPGGGSGTDSGDDYPWEHGFASTNGVTLHYVAAGPEDGPLVVLLHGFPEFWYAWRHQIPALADAGYRVVAPDMRGYNRSERPAGVAAYHLDELVGDVVGLIHEFDRDSAHVVGHDWGGVVAWQVAIDRPDVVEKLGILNAPHPSAYERELRRSIDQVRRSWYAFYFQVPELPEWGFERDDFATFDEIFQGWATNPEAFTDTDVERYRVAFSRPGAMTAAINYYRALFRRNARKTLLTGGIGDQPVDVPTLVLWGEQDAALRVELLDGLDQWVPDLRVERFPDASHWVQHDVPDRVSEELRAFVGSE